MISKIDGRQPEGRIKDDFKGQFADLTSESLLQLRARGDNLADDAHKAIEDIVR